MEVKYKVIYQDEVIKKHIPSISEPNKKLIKQAIENKLMVDPITFGKPLRYSLTGHRRLRVGDYRVVFRIEAENKTVVVIAIKHRSQIYDT